MEEQGRGNGRWATEEEGWVMEEEGREGGGLCYGKSRGSSAPIHFSPLPSTTAPTARYLLFCLSAQMALQFHPDKNSAPGADEAFKG